MYMWHVSGTKFWSEVAFVEELCCAQTVHLRLVTMPLYRSWPFFLYEGFHYRYVYRAVKIKFPFHLRSTLMQRKKYALWYILATVWLTAPVFCVCAFLWSVISVTILLCTV